MNNINYDPLPMEKLTFISFADYNTWVSRANKNNLIVNNVTNTINMKPLQNRCHICNSVVGPSLDYDFENDEAYEYWVRISVVSNSDNDIFIYCPTHC